MTELQASRTLVKSPPELWAECSDAPSLARHLGQFGQIRITRLDPETTVAWEGERASGTVRIEPAGWGTKVILTAVAVSEDPPRQQEPPQAPATPEPDFPPPRRRRFARLFGRLRRSEPVAVDRPEPAPVPEAEARPVTPEARSVTAEADARWVTAEAEARPVTAEAEAPPVTPDAEIALAAALDSLGQAHHRPFSRP